MHPSGAYLGHVALPALQWGTGSIDLYKTAWKFGKDGERYIAVPETDL